MMLALAAFNGDTVANFIVALCEVYLVLILLYMVLTMALSYGLRPPYMRWFDGFMNFLRAVCEPYIGIFRRFIRPVGLIDLSPMLAIIVLLIVEQLAVNVLGG